MAEYVNGFLYGVYPYIALSVFFLGSLVRFDMDQYSWRSGSSQLLRRRQLVLGSNLFHVGILVIFLGHFFGLLTPIALFHAFGIPNGFKQVMAMGAGGVAGVFCFIGLTMLLHRRLADPRIRRTSSFWDIAILVLLWIQLTLGMATILVSAQHLDGAEMVRFMEWANGVVTFRHDAAALMLDAPLLFKVHIFLGLTIFLVAPFTRLVHVWSAPVWYLGRKGYQIVRTLNHRTPA